MFQDPLPDGRLHSFSLYVKSYSSPLCFNLHLFQHYNDSHFLTLWTGTQCVATSLPYGDQVIQSVYDEDIDISAGDLFGWSTERSTTCPLYYDTDVQDHSISTISIYLPSAPQEGTLINKADIVPAKEVWSIGVNILINDTVTMAPNPPTHPSVPGKTTQPSMPKETTQPLRPNETTQPSLPNETTQTSTPDETTQPLTPDETIQTLPPDETTQPSEPDDTSQPLMPSEAIEPSNPDETTWPPMPIETTAPSNPDIPNTTASSFPGLEFKWLEWLLYTCTVLVVTTLLTTACLMFSWMKKRKFDDALPTPPLYAWKVAAADERDNDT